MTPTDRQEQQLMKASGWLAPTQRAAFIKSVENHLRDRAFVAGSDLRRAINLMLSSYGVSAPDNMENNNETI